MWNQSTNVEWRYTYWTFYTALCNCLVSYWALFGVFWSLPTTYEKTKSANKMHHDLHMQCSFSCTLNFILDHSRCSCHRNLTKLFWSPPIADVAISTRPLLFTVWTQLRLRSHHFFYKIFTHKQFLPTSAGNVQAHLHFCG